MATMLVMSHDAYARAELALGLAGAPTLITLTLAGCDLQAGFLAAFV